MKRLIILLAVSTLLAGCVTQRRCLEKFPPKEIVTYTDTIYFISVKTDTVKEYGTIRDTVYASNGMANGQAWVDHDTLFLDVWNTDTIIEYRDSIKTIIKEIPVKEKTKVSDLLQSFKVLVILIVIGIALVLVIRIIR